jgi:hypothetical protein
LLGIISKLSALPILPIPPISPIPPILPIAIPPQPLFSRAVHLFLDAAFLFEGTLLPFYEPTDKHITLVDKGDGYVGYRLV